MIRPIHPFPARMAPELAIDALKDAPPGSLVLDPMVGSGTVVRHASELGHQAVGLDLDPLAVMIARAWTTPVADSVVEEMWTRLDSAVRKLGNRKLRLAWIDDDAETLSFTEYWFGQTQRGELRRISYCLRRLEKGNITDEERQALDLIKLALSRIIITKDSGASLARDVSHSRPHRVKLSSDFDVQRGFVKSLARVRKLMQQERPPGGVRVILGDSRALPADLDCQVDLVVTSPPYLSAIDYLRGHRLALVWFGHRMSELRGIRSESIGAERCIQASSTPAISQILDAMGDLQLLSPRHHSIAERYAQDTYRLMAEIHRATKPGGQITIVIGNSWVRGVEVRNSEAYITASETFGHRLVRRVDRQIPRKNRYLPIDEAAPSGPIDKRLTVETVLTFTRP